MTDDHLDQLRARQTTQNSDVSRLERQLNDEFSKFQRLMNSLNIELMEARHELWKTMQELRASGVRPDDMLPCELVGFREEDIAK